MAPDMNAAMSKLELPEKWSKFLGEQPETGMGFQDVEITLADGRRVDGIAINGQTLETLLPIMGEDIASMRVKGAKEVGRHA